MKFSTFTLALISTVFTSVSAQVIEVGSCPDGMAGLDFKVTLDLGLADDNTFRIRDMCNLQTVFDGPLNMAVGQNEFIFCLNPLREYMFTWEDFERLGEDAVDAVADSIELTWILPDATVVPVVDVTLGTAETENDRTYPFGTQCGGPPNTDGDPHFKTLTGRSFDFHGQCDIVVLSAPGFMDGLGLDVHTRSKSRYQYSYIESGVVRIGDDILEVGSYGQSFFNGVADTNFPTTMGGGQFPVTHSSPEPNKHFYTIDLGEERGTIIMKAYKDMVGIQLPENVKMLGDNYYGILGQFYTGMDTVDREGALMSDMDAYGQEWQVRDTDGKLFNAVDHYPQWPEKCAMPTVSSDERRRLGEMNISEEQAALACKTAGRVNDMSACVYDVIAVGDLEMAAAGVF